MKKILLALVLVAFSTMMNAQTAMPALTSAAKEAAKATVAKTATQATQSAPVTSAKAAVANTVAKTKQVANPAAYACTKCFNIEKAEGKCSKCQGEKVQLGTYYCEHCMKASGTKAGKCSSCGMATTQMTRKFCAGKVTKAVKTAIAKKAA